MSDWDRFLNRLNVPWSCVDCGTSPGTAVLFSYGPCYSHEYRLGDAVNWSAIGPVLEDRLPQDTGLIPGRVACPNYWYPIWFKKEWKAPFNKPPPKTASEQRKFGCLARNSLQLELQSNVILRIHSTREHHPNIPPRGLHNILACSWVCPFCGYMLEDSMGGSVKFNYGPFFGPDDGVYHFSPHYRIRSKLDWTRPILLGNRLPNGSGLIEARAQCPRAWNGSWHGSQFWRDVPLKVRREYGCPRGIPIIVEFAEDIIVDIRFPATLEAVIGNDW